MKNLSIGSISSILTLAGVLAVGAGVFFNLSLLLGGGGALIGMGIVVSGIDSVIRGEATVGRRRRSRQVYTGLTGRLVGLFNIVMGILVVGGSYLVWSGGLNPSVTASFQEITRSELGISIAIIGLGMLLAFWSLIRVLGSDSQNRSAGMILLTLPLRLIGLVGVLLGIGAVVYGFARLIAPQWVEVAMGALGLPPLP